MTWMPLTDPPRETELTLGKRLVTFCSSSQSTSTWTFEAGLVARLLETGWTHWAWLEKLPIAEDPLDVEITKSIKSKDTGSRESALRVVAREFYEKGKAAVHHTGGMHWTKFSDAMLPDKNREVVVFNAKTGAHTTYPEKWPPVPVPEGGWTHWCYLLLPPMEDGLENEIAKMLRGNMDRREVAKFFYRLGRSDEKRGVAQ